MKKRNFMNRKERIDMMKTIGLVLWSVIFTIILISGCVSH